MTFYRSLLSSFLLLRSIQAQSGDGVSSANTETCPNALTNPSFSVGMEDWTWGTTPSVGGTYAFVSSTDSVEGDSYLQLSGNWLSGLNFYQTLDNVNADTVYTASADWRLQSSYSDGFECTLTLDSGDEGNAFFDTISAPSDDWSFVQNSVLVTTGLSFVVTIDCSQSSRNLADLYVDINNVELVPATCSSSSSSSSSSPSAASFSTSASSSFAVALSTPTSSSPAVILSTPSGSASIVASSTPSISSSAVVSSTPSSSSSITPSSSPVRIFVSASSQSASSVTPSSSIVPGSGLSSSRPCRSRRPSTSTSSQLQQSSVSESIGTVPTSASTHSTYISSASTSLTTSTILSTRTQTITACPPIVTNCPATAKTTYVTTETIVVSTTICPVTAQGRSTQTTASVPAQIVSGSGVGSQFSVSTTTAISYATYTAYTTLIETITACPKSITKCPASAKSTYETTIIQPIGVTSYPITSTLTLIEPVPTTLKATAIGSGSSSITTAISPFGPHSNGTASYTTPSSGVLHKSTSSSLSSTTTSSSSLAATATSTSTPYTGKAARVGLSSFHVFVAFCVAMIVRMCI